ncbi:MAG: glycosyl hydrolase family 18 protein [Anaerolineae bacterium]|nr:glycosyl hydrolase family 18 protein [Anaerolineae bacterium]
MNGLYGDPARRRGGGSPLLPMLAGVLLTVAVGAGVYWVALRAPEPAFVRNAVWLGVTWVNDPHADEEIRLLGEHLSANHVRYAYVYVSYLRVDRTEWNPTYDHARTFVRKLKAAAPDVQALAWLGVPARTEDGTYRLDSAAVRRRVAQFAARTVEQFDFDGVHVNVESVLDGNDDLPLLLEQVRDEIGPDVLLSIAVPPDWNPGLPEVPAGEAADVGAVWSTEYKQRVGALVDQVALMAYNSGLDTAADYETWVAYQVEQYSTALAGLDNSVELIVGVPTYAEDPGHDELAESLRAALDGVRDGLQRAGPASSVVGGIGLYAFWDTDAVEWALYRELWLQPQ